MTKGFTQCEEIDFNEIYSPIDRHNSLRLLLALVTRPDLVYASSLISRYMADLGKSHWEAIKWVLRYLKSTSEYVLVYKKVGNS